MCKMVKVNQILVIAGIFLMTLNVLGSEPAGQVVKKVGGPSRSQGKSLQKSVQVHKSRPNGVRQLSAPASTEATNEAKQVNTVLSATRVLSADSAHLVERKDDEKKTDITKQCEAMMASVLVLDTYMKKLAKLSGELVNFLTKQNGMSPADYAYVKNACDRLEPTRLDLANAGRNLARIRASTRLPLHRVGRNMGRTSVANAATRVPLAGSGATRSRLAGRKKI